ncbi:MAG: exosortase system-associated protein, TIGR04073 family [Candidatus Omnitrophica bacterium]|nr:exosortase system-associated protein, TIGR04073 family [Candidatus Omnitrophota bacterium]
MRLKISMLLFLLTVFMAPFASAEETVGDYMYGIGTKLGRGLENVVTSVAEIPCTIHADVKDQGGSGFFPGLGMGTVYMLRRMFVGVCEVGSFFIPMERTIPRVCHETKPAVV